MDLFELHARAHKEKNAPLADRMRPRTLDEFIGQEHIIGHGRLLRRAIQIDQLSSLIFYGPPGTGKTTLARIIANTTRAQFLSINAVLAGVKDIRDSIHSAQQTQELYGKKTILFIDEVHRFNKAQQDALLPHVENGTIILIGATTENPYFEVNKALVSRSRVFQLRSLTQDDLMNVAKQALADDQRGYGGKDVEIGDDALRHLVHTANGDARGVLNALELAVETTRADEDGVIRISREVAEESIQRRAVLYDKDGDAHYDTISAFIKSIRGSDPDAALYWMAKMVYAGEDPRFIFRRMIISACEDVGLADPNALGVVMDAAHAFDYVGMPEGRYHLAHACLYLCTAPKSNSSMAFFDALNMVSKEVTEDIPDHLRDANRDKESLGHGEGYLYPHAYRDHWVAQQYLPDMLQGRMFYEPSDQGYEKEISDQVARRREVQIESMVSSDSYLEEQTDTSRQWKKRTVGSSAGHMSFIRDTVLEAAAISRDHLVLDLHARTGLLTFEAARRADSGGVWACALDSQSYDTLYSMAQKFEPLRRPQIVQTDSVRLVDDIRKSAGGEVMFDRIVGRNALISVSDKESWLRAVTALMLPDGLLVLAETDHRNSTRLSDRLSIGEESLMEGLKHAEQKLFDDPANPLVNWTPEEIISLGEKTGLTVRSRVMPLYGKRRIQSGDVDAWFAPRSENKQGLSAFLRKSLEPEKISTLHDLARNQLSGRDIGWDTAVVLFTIRKTRLPSA
ncbi:MAG: AAA family ATPase [Chitinispirillaceae bacterium]